MVNQDRQKITAMVIALLAAFIMWIYITSIQNPQKTRIIANIPVTLVNKTNIQKSNLALLPRQNFNVELKVSGRAISVNGISSSDFQVVADMNTDLKKGDNLIKVTIKDMPKDIYVDTKNNPSIKIKLDNFMEKQVPVVINVSGEEGEGYASLHPVVKPSEVLVYGPETYVNSVKKVTGKVELNGNTEGISTSVPIKPQDKDGYEVEEITVDPQYADVTISVMPRKEVAVRVKTTGDPPEGKVLKQILADVDKTTVIGEANVLKSLQRIDTVPVDLSKITKTETIKVNLDMPQGVNQLGGSKEVSVTIIIEDIVEKTIEQDIVIENKTDEYNYTFSQEKANVKVKALSSVIEKFDGKGVKLSIDVKELKEGDNEVPIKVVIPEGLQLVGADPDKITVTLEKKQ